jgi:hypothetical protein
MSERPNEIMLTAPLDECIRRAAELTKEGRYAIVSEGGTDIVICVDVYPAHTRWRTMTGPEDMVTRAYAEQLRDERREDEVRAVESEPQCELRDRSGELRATGTFDQCFAWLEAGPPYGMHTIRGPGTDFTTAGTVPDAPPPDPEQVAAFEEQWEAERKRH